MQVEFLNVIAFAFLQFSDISNRKTELGNAENCSILLWPLFFGLSNIYTFGNLKKMWLVDFY